MYRQCPTCNNRWDTLSNGVVCLPSGVCRLSSDRPMSVSGNLSQIEPQSPFKMYKKWVCESKSVTRTSTESINMVEMRTRNENRRYLRHGSSDLLYVWFWGGVFAVGESPSSPGPRQRFRISVRDRRHRQ